MREAESDIVASVSTISHYNFMYVQLVAVFMFNSLVLFYYCTTVR